MSFSTKRKTRKLSSTKIKTKPPGIDSYTVNDLPSLRRKRTIALNRMTKALEIGLLAKSDDSQIDLFLSYCDQVKKIANDFEQAHFSILELLGTYNDDSEGDDDEVRIRVDDIYFKIMSMRRTFTREELNSSNISDNTRSKSSLSHVKLPKIQLPIFSGDIKKWPEFFDTFNALIHDCHSLTEVEKFHYLISSLSGDPLALIRVYPVTGNFYLDAYAALVARYQDKRELAFTCWKDFLNINFKSQNATEFRRTLDSIDENLSILKKLKLSVDHWDFILVYHVLSKLDTKLRREFEEKSVKSEFPTYSQLKDFLHSKCEALIRDHHFSEPSKSSYSVQAISKPTTHSIRRANFTHTLLADSSSTPLTTTESNDQYNKVSIKCQFCGDVHSILHCKSFLSKSIAERISIANEKRWCYNCLKGSHQLRNCVSVFRCIKCKAKHHTLICDVDKEVDSKCTNANSKSVSLFAKNSGTITNSKCSVNTTVLLATAVIQLQDIDGEYHSFRALFDTGSQNNFITCNAAQCLKLKPIPCDSNVQGLGGAAAEINGIIHCPIGTNNRSVFDVDMYVMSKICGDQPVAKLQTHGFSHIAELHLADPGFDIPGPIDVLLGADVFADSLLGERIKGDARQPLAINSLFGWLLLGRTPLITSSLLRVTTNSDELASIVQKFWELDLIPNASPLTPQEVACERAYIAEHYRDSSGRYGVHLPFKDNVEPSFVGSRDVAVRRFKAIERRLTRDPLLYQQYTEFMEDYLRSGHMSLVAVKDLNLGRYYIPHHCVIKPDSATTKLRVVFDASAQDVNHKSLNSTLLTGPKLQSNISEVLLRFRLHAVVFLADIRQMYRQIWVSEHHRDYQRIIWRSKSDQILQEYRLNTVTYGVASAPYLACRTIKQLAEDEGSRFPLAKNILCTDIYVDDVVTGCDTLDNALEAKSQLITLFSLGHFKLRKWASNVPGLLSDFSREECLLDPKSFSDEPPSTLKVLGLKWDPVTDTFQFEVASSNCLCTKRTILSELARIFDPLGFISPLTIKAKCLIQKLWILGISWDAEPPEDIIYSWKIFCDQLSVLQELQLPRRLTVDNAIAYELHGFCDSSELAYGAIIYLRALCKDGSVQIRRPTLDVVRKEFQNPWYRDTCFHYMVAIPPLGTPHRFFAMFLASHDGPPVRSTLPQFNDHTVWKRGDDM
ncbi:uncharacterized protein LOC120626429 [Pararge aegeria]|uniref:uncharacterized protein LOC120626429 n=1 Tax=Pararge aegeria TaxID=116150 RepID=UPI0019D06EB4|nr:uncharacterized protein LOC120626429 [Pararge aegeria]